MRTKLLTLCALLAMSAPLSSQSSTAPAPLTLVERLRLAYNLPIRTSELRDAGVADTTVRRIFDLFHEHRVEPVQVDQILVAERDAAREHGPTDNFGAFVQRQLAAGKRGRELSDAIRAEHRAHGHKHMKQKEKDKEKEKEHERANDNNGPIIQRPPAQTSPGSTRNPN